MQSLERCDMAITELMSQLQHDPWPVQTGKRPTRCTGAALSVAIGMMEVSMVFLCCNRCFKFLTIIITYFVYLLYFNTI